MTKKLLTFSLTLLMLCTSCLVSCKQQNKSSEMASTESDNQEINQKSFPETKSDLLLALSAADWTKLTAEQNLGERELYFNRYDVYPERGISIKYGEKYSDRGFVSLTGDVENLLFYAPYAEEVVSGVQLADTAESVKNILGSPAYISESENVFGYKTDGFYIFFVGVETIEEISIWPLWGAEKEECFEEDAMFAKEVSRLQMNKEILSLAEKGLKSPDGTKSIIRNDDSVESFSGFHVVNFSGEEETFSVLTPNFYCTGHWINDRYFLFTRANRSILGICDIEERRTGDLGGYDSIDAIEVFENSNRIECISKEGDYMFYYQFDESGEISIFENEKGICKITWE